MFDDPRSDDTRDRDDDPRDRNGRDREPSDPRDVFMRELYLPRTDERQRVHDRDREYSLRESETRTLATVGAFRVVSSRDLNDHHGREADPHSGDLRHLREEGLIRTIPMEGSRDVAVVLTDRGKHLLESHRHERDREDRQEFYAELKKPREMEHDAQIYGAYLREAERLQERDRGRADADGHPDRDEEEIETWAHEHDLPYFDGHVHFPDLRIEYEDRDGRDDHLDVEILTVHYPTTSRRSRHVST